MVNLLDWNVFPETNTLKNVGTGEEVKLSPRSMDVLGYLIAAGGRVVTSAELLDRFWGSADRSDHAVHNVIADLRAALGDRASNPRYIKTYTKRGYALIAAPVVLPPAASAGAPGLAGTPALLPQARHWRSVAVAVTAVTLLGLAGLGVGYRATPTHMDTVLVERFAAINVDPGNDHWVTQLPAGLVSHLSKIENLNVVSGFLDEASAADLQRLGRNTIDYVLNGSVLQEDNRLRLQIDLVNANDLAVVYSDQVDTFSDAVFDAHDQLGSSLASALRIFLDEHEREHMQNWGTSSPLAYNLFQKANFEVAQSNHADLELALASYAQAIEEDGSFINAYIGLAKTAGMLAMYSHDGRYNELRELANDALREVERIGADPETLRLMRDLALRLESDNRVLVEASLKDLLLTEAAPDHAYSRFASLLTEARLYYEADQYTVLAGDEPQFQLSPESDWVARTFNDSPDNLVQVQKQSLVGRPAHIGILNALIRGLVFAGDRRQAVYYLERMMDIDEAGAFAMLNQAIMSGLWGGTSERGDRFEQQHAANPDFNLAHGTRSFINGDIESGIAYWRALSASDRRRLQILLYKLEMYFPGDVLEDVRYQAFLDELDVGMNWQRYLMESVQELSAVTGVQLHPKSRAAYDSRQFLVNNNLWHHEEMVYPNRSPDFGELEPGE